MAKTRAFAWMEAETPSEANFDFQPQRTAHPEILSDGQWLFKSIAKKEIPKSVPAQGLLLRYDLEVPEDGAYHVWIRVGQEHARSPIDWRVNTGAWATVGPYAHTTSLMRPGPGLEVAWLELGTVNLHSGPVSLQLRVKQPGSGGNVVLGLDAVAFVQGHWIPEGRLKPGEEYNSPDDQTAAARAFGIPDSEVKDQSTRLELRLDGLWQAARYDDPNMDKAPLQPVTSVPDPSEYPLRWMAIKVPSNAWDKPELSLAHRIFYRTRVNIPMGLRGRSFLLHFSGTSWITSVLVNGLLIDSHQTALEPWDLDISRAVQPGETNEITIAVKSPWYAVDAKGMNSSLEKLRDVPAASLARVRWTAPAQSLSSGDTAAFGLVRGVKLVVAGSVYASTVQVHPDPGQHEIDADVTVHNPGTAACSLMVKCDAVSEMTGELEESLPAAPVTVPPGGDVKVTIRGAWTGPTDNTIHHTLRTTLSENGAAVDVQQQPLDFPGTIAEGGVLVDGVSGSLVH